MKESKMVKLFKIESDAFLVCMTHALSTEQEEVMGLLIGEITDDGVSHAHTVIMLRRSDKRKDRVEISPEQLSNASNQAEVLGKSTRAKKPLRIIGWYHSHPHITVWPSHVDVRTQLMYQLMDQDFVGVIISCFNDDPSTSIGNVQITCFQAVELPYSQIERLEIELEIVPSPSFSDATLLALIDLPVILEQEESEAYERTVNRQNMQDLITAIHNGTVYTKAICQLLDVVCAPLLQTFERRLKRRTVKLNELKSEKAKLELVLASMKRP